MSTAGLVVSFVLLFYFLLDQASCDKTPTDSCLLHRLGRRYRSNIAKK
jgi:hypothetical protein